VKLTKTLIRSLIAQAVEARENAYAPYSRFHVGAALLADDGTVYAGCNVENSSFGATNCAERTALFAAVADGHRAFRAIAVVADAELVPPCGLCRQVLAEFAPDLPIILARLDGSYAVHALTDLLPLPFSGNFLR
jgi:cytidine deaminase